MCFGYIFPLTSIWALLVLLPPEGAPSVAMLSHLELTEDSGAASTQSCACLPTGDFVASWPFYTSELGTQGVHQVSILEFLLSGEDEEDSARGILS